LSRLITFGCSTTQGEGLENPHTETWGYHLSNYFGLEHINQGIAGASNKLISYKITTFDYQPDDIVFILWCNVNRYSVLHSDTEYDKIYPLSPTKQSELYYKYFHSDVDQSFTNKAFTTYALNHLKSKQIKYNKLFFNKELEQYYDILDNTIPVYLSYFYTNYPLGLDNLHLGKEGNEEYAKKIYNQNIELI